MSGRPPIEGRVARILNLRELAINRGSNHGVSEGMVFDVMDPKAEDITDPETEEILGSVYRPKVQVKVFAVEERLSLARTFKSTRVNKGGTGGLGGLTKAFEPPKWVETWETLKTTESTWQDLDESESIVKTGDPVVEAIVADGDAQSTGSRTLEFPGADEGLARQFAEWFGAQGWSVGQGVGEAARMVDLVATRGDDNNERDIVAVEVKARRNPLGASDLAQAVGQLSLYAHASGNQPRLALVVGPAGLTETAREFVKASQSLIDVYQADDVSGIFTRLTETQAALQPPRRKSSRRLKP